MLKLFITCLIALQLFTFGKASAQSNYPDSARVMKDLFVLASDSLQGREVGTPGGKKARKYIIKRLQDAGVSAYVPGYEQPFTFSSEEEEFKGVNLLGYVKGYSSEDIIVLSAHYDHVGMVDSTKIFNGADDNASGTTALLAMAKYFTDHQPENTLVFAFFDAEESGLRGARHFVNSIVADSTLLKMNINMDMVSRSDKREIYAVGTHFHPELKMYLNEAAKGKNLTLKYGRDVAGKKPYWVNASDHGPFHQKGIPFIYFGVDDHPDYHKPTDTADKVDPDFYLEVITLITASIENLDANLGLINAK